LPNRSWHSGYREFQAKVYSAVAAIDSLPFTTHSRVASATGTENIRLRRRYLISRMSFSFVLEAASILPM
jgi:hypothetical protein